MLPVCEDARLAELAETQQLRLADLLSISSVCGVGIDTVPLPGDVTDTSLASLVLDVAGLADRWNKPLSCRVFPLPGKKFGDHTSFDSPHLISAVHLLKLTMPEDLWETRGLASQSPSRPYHCIHCLGTNSSLYRIFNETSVKLTACQTCGLDVDPYVEREISLVIMDLVLLRQDAYRHLLLNDHRLAKDFDVSKFPGLSFQYMVAACLLQCYILSQSSVPIHESLGGDELRMDDPKDFWRNQTLTTLKLFLYLFLHACVRLLLFGTVCYSCLRLWGHKTSSTSILMTRTFLAVILPNFFSVVTAFVMIWEDTYMVRLLGSLLILMYRLFGVSTVASAQGLTTFTSVLTVALAVLVSSSTMTFVSVIALDETTPCAGFAYSFGQTPSNELTTFCFT
jgi:hypothetical protein